MLVTLEQMKKLRWLHHIPNEPDDYFGNHFQYISDGTETWKDLEYIIHWSHGWSEAYGYQIINNYEELELSYQIKVMAERLHQLNADRGENR